MPSIVDILTQLQRAAQPRPDIITPDATGMLENARPYTYAGRVGTQRQPITQKMLSRPAMDVPDVEGWSMMPQLATASLAYKQLPPWMQRNVEDTFTRLAKAGQLHTATNTDITMEDWVRRMVQIPIRQNPLNPLQALQTARASLTDKELANLIMANSLLGPTATGWNDIERLLPPEKLAELKRWAHDVLSRETQVKPAASPHAMGSVAEDVLASLYGPSSKLGPATVTQSETGLKRMFGK